jgi:5-methylcytosine-specific restriction endonuclease McrA
MKFGAKPTRQLAEILIAGSHPPPRLRLRLIREGLKEPRCENCGLDSWNGVQIPLELDHRNGRRDDNRIENLTLLCPNCHAQTPTYRGRNIGRYKRDEATDVPGVGIEPTRPFDQRGLGPPRLPITPPGRLF